MTSSWFFLSTLMHVFLIANLHYTKGFSLYFEVTPRNSMHLGKFLYLQLIQKFPGISGQSKSHCPFYTSPPLVTCNRNPLSTLHLKYNCCLFRKAITKKCQLHHISPSVCPSACKRATHTRTNFVKFPVQNSYQNLSTVSDFVSNVTKTKNVT